MTHPSTTIRVSVDQRERLRKLAAQRNSTMADTLDAALDALKRTQFYEDMAKAEAMLRADPVAWAAYVSERDAWLNPELTSNQ
jgi:predicted transcriptional regulator